MLQRGELLNFEAYHIKYNKKDNNFIITKDIVFKQKFGVLLDRENIGNEIYYKIFIDGGVYFTPIEDL